MYCNEDISTKSIEALNNISNDFDYLNIRQEVINLMDYFARAFDRNNKNDLITAIKDLSKFAEKYKFDYVTKLTLDWLLKLQDKKYDKCELKYIGYYNQIRDIMDKMLKELKKKADLIIISQQKKKNNNTVNDTIIPPCRYQTKKWSGGDYALKINIQGTYLSKFTIKKVVLF